MGGYPPFSGCVTPLSSPLSSSLPPLDPTNPSHFPSAATPTCCEEPRAGVRKGGAEIDGSDYLQKIFNQEWCL